MATARPRIPAPHRIARTVALLGLAAAASSTLAQATDCAIAESALRSRGEPVCSPPGALSPAQVVSCAEHARLVTIVADCRRAATRDNVRWLSRYPDEAAHRTAQAAEIQSVVVKLRAPNERLAELLAQFKVLKQKAEFFPDGQLPRELQRELDANSASMRALRDLFRGLELEVAAVVDKYDDERAHLRKLWAGAPPGSVGVFTPRTVGAAAPGKT
jgi:hypothetical protein